MTRTARRATMDLPATLGGSTMMMPPVGIITPGALTTTTPTAPPITTPTVPIIPRPTPTSRLATILRRTTVLLTMIRTALAAILRTDLTTIRTAPTPALLLLMSICKDRPTEMITLTEHLATTGGPPMTARTGLPETPTALLTTTAEAQDTSRRILMVLPTTVPTDRPGATPTILPTTTAELQDTNRRTLMVLPMTVPTDRPETTTLPTTIPTDRLGATPTILPMTTAGQQDTSRRTLMARPTTVPTDHPETTTTTARPTTTAEPQKTGRRTLTVLPTTTAELKETGRRAMTTLTDRPETMTIL